MSNSWTKLSAPDSNTYELSVFGSGVGECLVIHLGSNNWMVVDSFLNKVTGNPIAEDYFKQIGVDLSTQVKLILVTHWHDDHIRGISSLLRNSSIAKFACSNCLSGRDFIQLIKHNNEKSLVRHMKGLSEFEEVLSIQGERSPPKSYACPNYYADHSSLLYDINGQLRVRALSPSAQEITRSVMSFERLIQQSPDKLPSCKPNEQSVVLSVESKSKKLLLGADMENASSPVRGWNAIVASERHKDSGHIYKVAHHGSEGADNLDIWNTLLHQKPLSVVTPYARGRKPLPSEDDVDRLKTRSGSVYCTTFPPFLKPKKRSGVNGQMSLHRFKNHRKVNPKTGLVRFRFDDSHALPIVDIYENAQLL